MYRVLIPSFESAGISSRTGKESFYVHWERIGYANDMDDAKRLHPCPVLESVEDVSTDIH